MKERKMTGMKRTKAGDEDGKNTEKKRNPKKSINENLKKNRHK